MKIQPLGNRLLVEEEKIEEKTSSGIVLPDTAEKEKSQFGVIVSLGDGKKLQNSGLKKGDKVVLEKFGPVKWK
jgi:chaperonin GroES